MRKLQEIFNITIDSGCYYKYMCPGLDTASEEGFITFRERDKAIRAINKLIQDRITLSSHLTYGEGIDYSIASDCEFRLKIYRNWSRKARIIKEAKGK